MLFTILDLLILSSVSSFCIKYIGNYPRFSPVLRNNQGSRDVYFKLFYKMADMCQVARVIIGNGAMEYIYPWKSCNLEFSYRTTLMHLSVITTGDSKLCQR